jgi:hypothetical protein
MHEEMVTRLGKLNVRSFYSSGSLNTVLEEVGKYKLELVALQEARWEKGGTERAQDYTFFMENGMRIIG